VASLVLLTIKEKVTAKSNIPNTLTLLTLFGKVLEEMEAI
jgi:hypothetical protein